MANNKHIKRTFRCSDAEWEKITQSAKMMNLSASRFLVKKAYSEGDSDLPRILENIFKRILEDDLTRILGCSRLLAFDLMDRLRTSLPREDYDLILARAKHEYDTLDGMKKKQTESTQQHD